MFPFPQNLKVPFLSANDIAIQAANELVQVLKNPQPAIPLTPVGTQQVEAPLQLAADIFQTSTKKVPSKIARVPVPVIPTVIGPPPRAPVASCSQLPRVEVSPSPPPFPTPTLPRCHPTRHMISQCSQDEGNQIETINPPATIPEPATHWASAIIDPDSAKAVECRHLIQSPQHEDKWTKPITNKFGRLAQGMGGQVKETNTIFFINHNKLPQERCKDVTRGRICVSSHAQKAGKERTHITVGGNVVNCSGDVSTPTSGTTTAAKLVINSAVSTPGAKRARANTLNFCLGAPVDCHKKCMKMPLSLVPQEIIDECDLLNLARNGHIHIVAPKGHCQRPKDAAHVATHPASGITNGAASCSPLSWTILELSLLAKNAPIISAQASKKTMDLLKIGQESCLVESHSSGITSTESSICPCPDGLQSHHTNSSTQLQPGDNMPRTHGQNQRMEPNNNSSLHLPTTQHHFHPKASNELCKSTAPSHATHEPSIQPRTSPSAPSTLKNPRPPNNCRKNRPCPRLCRCAPRCNCSLPSKWLT